MKFLDRPAGALVASLSAAALSTNLVGASFTAAPNSLAVGQVWKMRMHFTYLHAAATTPTLTFELAVAGTAVVAAVATPVATATTFHGWAEAYFTVRSVGVSGSLMGSVHVGALGLTLANAEGGAQQVDTVADVIDTTQSRLIEFRARMTTAVASNTLTIAQGWPERLVA